MTDFFLLVRMLKVKKLLDENQRDSIAKTFLDFSKIIMAALFANEFFKKFPRFIILIIWGAFIVMFCLGVYFSRKQEEKWESF